MKLMIEINISQFTNMKKLLRFFIELLINNFLITNSQNKLLSIVLYLQKVMKGKIIKYSILVGKDKAEYYSFNNGYTKMVVFFKPLKIYSS